MEPERLFSFTWHPYAVDPKADYSGEPSTLVEFTLERIPTGTRLRIVESGFDKLPAHRRDEAFRMNDRGWSIQTEMIARHVEPPHSKGGKPTTRHSELEGRWTARRGTPAARREVHFRFCTTFLRTDSCFA